MMNRTILFLFITLSTLCCRAQQTWYFKNNPVKGKGSRTEPFGNITSFFPITFHAGDTVLFYGGDTIKANLLITGFEAKKPLVLSSWGKNKAVIDGGTKEALVLNHCSGIIISNLVMRGDGRKTGSVSDGLKLTNCHQVSLQNLDISGFQKSGLLIYNSTGIVANGILAHDNGASGILVEGDYQKRISDHIIIKNCKAFNNPGDPTNLNNHSGNGIIVGNCKNVLIEYCTATNNGWDMPRIGNGPVGIWAYEADSVVIQYCISYKNKTAAGASDGGGFDLDGGVSNSIIQYCLSYGNQGSGYGIYTYYGASSWHDNIVRFCVSMNDGQITKDAAGMLIWNGNNGDSSFSSFTAHNNIFYNDGRSAFAFSPLAAHHDFHFYNNIFIACDTCNIFVNLDSSKTDEYLANIWMRKSGGFFQDGFTNMRSWTIATGYENKNGNITGGVYKDPLFIIRNLPALTDPHQLKTDPFLLSLKNGILKNRSVNRDDLFQLPMAEKDFFGNKITPANIYIPGICVKY